LTTQGSGTNWSSSGLEVVFFADEAAREGQRNKAAETVVEFHKLEEVSAQHLKKQRLSLEQ